MAWAEAMIIAGIISWVFYDSVFGMVLLIPIGILNTYRVKDEYQKKQRKKFDLEFKEFLLSVSDALQSGYSVENAFKDALENIKLMFGDGSCIAGDLIKMNSKIAMRVSAEKAFMEFAQSNPSEETLSFAQVFAFARKLGGDYIKNIRRTIEKMEEKFELKQEIATTIAGKQMEFKVMCAMPAGILIYVKVTSGAFLDGLYKNTLGVAVMSVCLVIYALAVFLGAKIVDIKV